MYIITVFSKLGPPPSVSVFNITTCINDIALSWSPVTSNLLCGPVSYDVTISSSDGVMMVRTTDTSYDFTGLTPDNSYIVTVTGRNDAGVGGSSIAAVNTPSMAEAVPTGT